MADRHRKRNEGTPLQKARIFLLLLSCCVAARPIACGGEPAAAVQPVRTSPGATPLAEFTATTCANQAMPFDSERVARLASAARHRGSAIRGLELFSSDRLACLSCHQVGGEGSAVGPPLTDIGGRLTTEQIAESILWPSRQVAPEYSAWLMLTTDGKARQGYKRRENERALSLFDIALQEEVEFSADQIAEVHEVGTVMPENLLAALSLRQQADLVRFLSELRGDSELLDALARRREPAPFEYDRTPLRPEAWPHWQENVNRDRHYDFYEKQAEHFRQFEGRYRLLPAFPGLDGPVYGHWGNQDETTWRDGRWNEVDVGTLLSGVFNAPDGVTTPKGVCVRLGEHGELSTCFNPQSLSYESIWRGAFLQFSDVRHGFLDGLRPAGELLSRPADQAPAGTFTYRGFYRFGQRVLFAYRADGVDMLDAPWVEDGKFVRTVAPADKHPLRAALGGGPAQWPQEIVVAGRLGAQRPYAIDDIPLPKKNPWHIPVFCGDHAFLSDGSVLVCTMHGDVWRAASVDDDLERIAWRRIASGLHQPLGMVVHEDAVYVLGRDQVTRLHDLNGDGETDFYECVSNVMVTSPSGHDFICGLARDDQGRFYAASSNQGLIRIASDGRSLDVLATGLRNPDGIHLAADGSITVPASEGEWTPASMVCRVPSRDNATTPQPPLHFGYGGPREGQAPALPLAYLPRGLDNSSGGQATVPDDRWGPLAGRMIHLSYGSASHFLLLKDEVAGQAQGAIAPLSGDFASGVHRAKFNPRDGQLYVSGMGGWGAYSSDDGCLQRVRYTGDPVQLPSEFHVHQNGVLVRFTQPIDRAKVGDVRAHFAQAWNYRYSSGYGSPELSPRLPGVVGHDVLDIAGVHPVDERTVFVELPDLQPVSTLHLSLAIAEGPQQQLFVTVHKLDRPFENFDGYRAEDVDGKVIAEHPLVRDLAALAPPEPNPWREPIANARALELQAGKNVTFLPRTLTAKTGEAIQLTFANPDAVPHNWALVKPGRLQAVGALANKLGAEPDAARRQYVPATDNVLVYTDVVEGGASTTIYIRAPLQAGRYPFLCTFPGHWMVMNGELVVE
jgi:putative heme-binding domain-containing protein